MNDLLRSSVSAKDVLFALLTVAVIALIGSWLNTGKKKAQEDDDPVDQYGERVLEQVHALRFLTPDVRQILAEIAANAAPAEMRPVIPFEGLVRQLPRLEAPVQQTPQKKGSSLFGSLEMEHLTLQSNKVANWNLQDAKLLTEYLEHPGNSLITVNLCCYSGWDPFSSDLKPEVFGAILDSLGRMPRLQSLSLDVRGLPLSALPHALLHLPHLEIRQATISSEDAIDFVQALRKEDYDKKRLAFRRLDDSSVSNLFCAMKVFPMDNIEKLEASRLGILGVNEMTGYLEKTSVPELVLLNNSWPNHFFRPLVNSLLEPTNGVARLEFHHASFPPESKHLWKRLLENKNNLQALSFYHLRNHWNEGLARALVEAKLPDSMTTLELINSIPLQLSHLTLAGILPSVLQRNPQLRDLNLRTNLEGLRDDAIVPIAKALMYTQMERLDLSNALLTQTGFQVVIRSLPRRLKHLNLSRIEISDETAQLLGNRLSGEDCPIEELILDWCKLTPLGVDAILQSLAANSRNSRLTKLSLQWCDPLGTKGHKLLIQYLPDLSSLRELSFGCFPWSPSRLEGNAKAEMRKRRRDVQEAKFYRKQLLQILRENADLIHIQIQLDVPVAGSADYFARRNQFFQHHLHALSSNESPPSWDDLMCRMRKTLEKPKEDDETTITTSLMERAFPTTIPTSAAPRPGTDQDPRDWELSLLFECLLQRPDWVATGV